TCHSGGTVDIYLEPILPAPRLLLFGTSPVVRALAQLGKAMGYAAEVVAPGADRAGLPPVDRVITDLAAAELRGRGGDRLFAAARACAGWWGPWAGATRPGSRPPPRRARPPWARPPAGAASPRCAPPCPSAAPRPRRGRRSAPPPGSTSAPGCRRSSRSASSP